MPQGSGSGFVWDKQGHVVTNYHVIRGASDLRFVRSFIFVLFIYMFINPFSFWMVFCNNEMDLCDCFTKQKKKGIGTLLFWGHAILLFGMEM